MVCRMILLVCMRKAAAMIFSPGTNPQHHALLRYARYDFFLLRHLVFLSQIKNP